jgi:hypothetical protein
MSKPWRGEREATRPTRIARLQRWEPAAVQVSLRGTVLLSTVLPGVETPGHFQMSLRDNIKALWRSFFNRPFLLVRERLNLRYARVGPVHEPGSRARMQPDVHGNHVKRVGEIESVQRFLEIAAGVVDIDRAAGLRLA